MSRETVAEKAGRLLEDQAVTIIRRSPDFVIAEVAGDHHTYRVTLSTDGSFLGCTCPATTTCAHILATQQEAQLTYANHDAPEPEAVDPETGEVLEILVEEADEPDQAADPSEAGDGEALPAPVDTALISVTDAPITSQTLRFIAKTDFVPASLRGKPEAILACVLHGRSMGLDPMQSLTHIHVIDGQPQPSAQLLGRLIRAAGHSVEVVEMTDAAVRLRGTRADSGETLEVGFSIEDAQRAGLVTIDEDGHPRARSRGNNPMPWELHPDDMLWARALSKLHRRLFQDVMRLPSP
jgi:hypothetical protein